MTERDSESYLPMVSGFWRCFLHGHDPLVENRVILVEATNAPGGWRDGSLGYIAVRITGLHMRRLVVLRWGLD